MISLSAELALAAVLVALTEAEVLKALIHPSRADRAGGGVSVMVVLVGVAVSVRALAIDCGDNLCLGGRCAQGDGVSSVSRVVACQGRR